MDSFFDNLIKSLKKCFSSKENTDEPSKAKKYNIGNVLILVLLGAVLIMTANVFSKKSALTNGSNSNNGVNIKGTDIKEKTMEKNSEGIDRMNRYGDELNKKLTEILSSINGVGKVKSMIYFQGGEEYIPAVNENNSISTTEEADTNGGKRKINQNNDGKTIVTFSEDNNTKPLITHTKAPKIVGLCIVAEGAEDKITELRIMEAVINLFDIPESKVHVYPMK
ncbi:stage III sporulation protein AG [Hathewaya proteolytica DSM 3090]|uniref:Stage III sporulation protein AG n=1 Tax=Hathewaya proteolytica DSM 3090 TaxID=1121331 RepID=A0A1M6L561_9CLOT|nr:stage III sporulation protein AG [Hathewaya proteolytica]SHJ66310.1 stage III sporulation protein AG [Hathewaya proteolytica DSM 3090]